MWAPCAKNRENVSEARDRAGYVCRFKAVLDTGRVKIPFGIAQIGKSFATRSPRATSSSAVASLKQMEMEFFISDDDDWEKWHRVLDRLVPQLAAFRRAPGLAPFRIQPRQREAGLLLEGHNRHHVPLSVSACRNCGASPPAVVTIFHQHAKFSGASMEYFDEEKKRKYVPHVIEPAVVRGPHHARHVS